jgi:uncharacterized small protein (DUF1192 family)
MMKTDYALPDISGLLPDRPIAVRHPGFADRIQLPFLALVAALVALGTLWFAGPGLYADYRIKNNPVEVPQAYIADGQCKSRKFTVHCKAEISYLQGFEHRSHKVDFSFMGVGSGDYQTAIVAEKGHPDNITLSLAIDEFWNRVIGFALLVFFSAAGAVLLVLRFFQISTSLKALQEPARLEPIWARITMQQKKWGKLRITYTPASGVKKGVGVSVVGKTETLWTHDDPVHGESFVLAVRHPEARLPVMLDEGFERLELSHEEANAARAARNALFRQLAAG